MAIVTISRKMGSLGDEIAREVAKQMAIRIIERADIHRLALACDQDLADMCQRFESELPAGFFERIFFRDPAGASLFASLIYQEAALGDVVISGRGSQIVLGKYPGVLKVRIVAPFNVRVERMAERNGISLEDANSYVRRYDHQRRGLIESIFHVDLSDWSLYDMVLNSNGLSMAQLVEVITVAASKMSSISNEQKSMFADMALAKRVEALIKKKVPIFSVRDVEVQNLGQGHLVLTGAMMERDAIKKAVEIAEAQAEVNKVESQLINVDSTLTQTW